MSEHDPRILADQWHGQFLNKCGYPPDAEDGYSAGYRAALGRIEELRKALFEARDCMTVMSGWVLKSDPAGFSWAVRMVDRANAVLNHESPSGS
jgi:flavin-dependent dehydrogenase